MFRCAITGRLTRPGEKCNKIVIEKREKVYTQMIWEGNDQVEVEIGKGWEIVKEVNASDEGVRIYNQMVEAGTISSLLSKLK
jgi:hypothetical protein